MEDNEALSEYKKAYASYLAQKLPAAEKVTTGLGAGASISLTPMIVS
jgi:hypothetical protein